jgi:TRAP-type C4-dicarboxylate transport system permease small subunit
MFEEPKLPWEPPGPAGPFGATEHDARSMAVDAVAQAIPTRVRRVSRVRLGVFIVVVYYLFGQIGQIIRMPELVRSRATDRIPPGQTDGYSVGRQHR